jgi:hypothetical protein
MVKVWVNSFTQVSHSLGAAGGGAGAVVVKVFSVVVVRGIVTTF